VTKGGVSTSNGSSWSWTRSGTVWDDDPNNWSESWSKSSWKDGKYAPNESESKTGGFDPKKTGPQVNDVPKFGEAPRLNKPPKQEVPPDLVKPPKPSDDIWAPTFIRSKEPQFKDVFTSSGSDSPSGGSGNDNLPDKFFGGLWGGGSGEKLPENKRSALTKVIIQLNNFFGSLAQFVAGAVYQWLLNNREPVAWLLKALSPGWNGLEKDVERGLPKSWAFNAGRTFGDGAAIVTGILEIIAGSGAAGGGGSLCITGFGCIAGAPAIVAGTALALHGSGTASAGLRNILADIAENLGVVFQSSSGKRNSGGRPYEQLIRSRETSDGYTQVEWRISPKDPRTPVVTFKEVNPNVIEVSDIFPRDFPRRIGGNMIANALRTKGINRPSTIRLTNVTHAPTKEAIEQGIAVENTILGDTLKDAARELGATPTSWSTSTTARGHLWIEVKLSY
jgi:hypothetical protein